MRVPESIGELRQICQVSFHGWSSQEFAFLQIRKVSIYVTWVLLHFPLTANHVTLLAIVTGLVATVVLGTAHFLAGIIVLLLSMVFDFCDGEVSRYRSQQSKEGSYLDKVYHFLVHPSVFAGLAIGAYQTHSNTFVIVVGFITTISVFANTMIKGYAGELATWAHCKRYLKRLNAALEAEPNDTALLSALLSSGASRQLNNMGADALVQKVQHSYLAQIVSKMSNYWDFPYIFFCLITAVLVQFILPVVTIGGTGFTPLEIVLLFFSLTYPVWMVFFLSYILLTKQISRGYQSFADDLSLLLERASKAADDGPSATVQCPAVRGPSAENLFSHPGNHIQGNRL